jgi:hypothetical protein
MKKNEENYYEHDSKNGLLLGSDGKLLENLGNEEI